MRAALVCTLVLVPFAASAQTPNDPVVSVSATQSAVTGAFASSDVEYDMGGANVEVSRTMAYAQYDRAFGVYTGYAQLGWALSSRSTDLDADGHGYVVSGGVKRELMRTGSSRIIGIAALRLGKDQLSGSKTISVPLAGYSSSYDYDIDMSSTMIDAQVFSVFGQIGMFEPYAGASILLLDDGSATYTVSGGGGSSSTDYSQKQAITLRTGATIHTLGAEVRPELALMGEQTLSVRVRMEL